MNSTIIKIIILSLFIILNLTVVVRGFLVHRNRNKKYGIKDDLISDLILLTPIFAFAVLLYYWEEQTLTYWATIVLFLTTQSFLTFSSLFSKKFLHKNAVYMIVGTVLLLFISSIIITPIVFINHGRINESEERTLIDITEIEDNFLRIRKTIENLEINIQNETKNIAKVSNSILGEIIKKKKELDEMELKYISLEEEVVYYKQLANLSKGDAELVLKTINENQNKGKYFEYFLGLFIGILGSIIASFVYKKIDVFFNIKQKKIT